MTKNVLKSGLLLMLMAVSTIAMAQSRYLRGKVTTPEGNPAEGATVKVKGTNTSTETNKDGEWALAVAQDAATLEISLNGFLTTEATIAAGSDIINTTIEPDKVGINSVTVTALGIRKEKRALGFSNQTVQGTEVQGSGEQNVVQALSSKVAGAIVTGSGGTPGASSKIILRGATTFTNENQPLIVVDGVPIDNSTTQTTSPDYPFNENLQGVNNSNRAIDINPADIETINVLKGPAAAALYGVRGANGAIIITTKRGGAKGKSFGIDISTSIEFQHVNRLIEKQRKYGQGAGGGTAIFSSTGADSIINAAGSSSLGTPESWGALVQNPINNEENFFRTGVSWNNNIGLNVGGEKTTARFSLGSSRTNGIVPNTTYNRTTVRVNTDTRLNSKWAVASSVNFINSGGTRAQNGSNLAGAMLSLLRSPSDFDLAGGTGSKNYLNPDGSMYTNFFLYDNPYFSSYENTFTDDVTRLLGNINLSYDPLSWLSFNWRVGTDQWTDARKQIFAVGSNQPDNAPGGEINYNTLRYKEWYSDFIVNISKTFNKDFSANLLIGNNLNTRADEDQYLRGRDLAIPGFYNLSNASNLYSASTSSKVKTAAWFGNLELNYKRYLYLTLTGRNEWASTFGDKQSSFFYPSANLAFVFTEIMNKSKVLSFGKVRAAFAQAGVNPPAYRTSTYYGQPFFSDGFTSGLSFPYLSQNGFGQSTRLGNSGLKPEKSTGLELGFDLRFFGGRLNADITLYQQKSTDILVLMPIAVTSGFEEVTTNSGEMVNRGIEAILGATAIESEKHKFSWDINVNFSTNKNEVLKLAPGVDEIDIETAFSSVGSYAIVGQPYGVLYGSRWERKDGQLVIGANGLPVVAATRGNIGNPYPKWMMGLRNTFNYKGIGFTFLWDVRQGGQVWNGTYARMNRLGLTKESEDRDRTYLIEGVTAQGTPNTTRISAANYYRVYKGDAGANAAENAVQDGGWVRLREIGINYTIKIGNKNIRSVDVGFTGRNLLLFTKYKGIDPETSLTGAGSNIGGFDYFNNPGTRSFMFNLRISI